MRLIINRLPYVLFFAVISVLGVTCTFAAETPADTSKSPAFERLNIQRIGELYNLVDTFGGQIWPGFDIRQIPIGINDHDQRELLIAHPSPGPDFRPFDEFTLDNQPMYIRNGCTIFGPGGGGWATDINRVKTAYVSVEQEGQSTDSYLSLLLHECFHVFQDEYRQRADSAWGELPELDAENSAMIVLGSRILHRILTDESEGIRRLAGMFVAVREERRRNLAKAVILSEGEEEYNEGTATYVQAKLYQLLARQGGMESTVIPDDSCYNRFQNADSAYKSMIELIIPPESTIVTFFHSKYRLGMAEGLVLDRLDPDWKKSMSEKGSTQFGILEKTLALNDEQKAELLEAARSEFGYDEILKDQQRLVKERTDLLCNYIEAPGRRYRIYFSVINMPFKWKPLGPVYNVPNDLMKQIDERLAIEPPVPDRNIVSNQGPTLWTGGFERFEEGGLLFESGKVPILFRFDYFEWIDTDPAEDGSDLIIESSSQEGDVYSELKMVTDGFELTIPKARIIKDERVVAVIPVVED